jgi:hypothetical protein
MDQALARAEKEADVNSRAQFVILTMGKPTPTQEENDLAMLGATVMEKEPDGSVGSGVAQPPIGEGSPKRGV